MLLQYVIRDHYVSTRYTYTYRTMTYNDIDFAMSHYNDCFIRTNLAINCKPKINFIDNSLIIHGVLS